VAGGLAVLGVVLGAVYMLTMYKDVFFGPVTNAVNRQLKDLSLREVLVIVPILVLIFWIGLFPRPFLARIEPTTQVLLGPLQKAGATHWLAAVPSSPSERARAH